MEETKVIPIPALKGNHTKYMLPTLKMMSEVIDKIEIKDLTTPMTCSLDG